MDLWIVSPLKEYTFFLQQIPKGIFEVKKTGLFFSKKAKKRYFDLILQLLRLQYALKKRINGFITKVFLFNVNRIRYNAHCKTL